MSRRRQTTVVRIPREAYEEAERLRNEYMKRPKNGTDPFAIIAIAGISAFIGGLIGYAVANLQQQQQSVTDQKKEGKRR
jgi:hypothetical protein